MTKNKMSEPFNDYSDDEYFSDENRRKRLNQLYEGRKITADDIETLQSVKNLKITQKIQENREIFDLLMKCDVLWSYEILEFLQPEDPNLKDLPWIPAHLRLHNYVHIHNEIGKHIFRMHIGGNTSAVDWTWYTTEDYYFPDFDIYNDVSIKYFDGTYELWHYPQEQFPPVYAHATAYNEATHKAYITGGLGLGDRQRKNITEIYELDMETKEIQQVQTIGDSPVCLHHHQANFYYNGIIEMTGGYILKNGRALKNLYTWYFNLTTKKWSKRESEHYHHWVITPEEGSNFLFRDYKILLDYEKNDPTTTEVSQYLQHLLKNNLYVADYNVYSKLYKPIEEMECNQVDDWIHHTYQCVLDHHHYQCCEDDQRLEVVFQASSSDEFQAFILDDLKAKLKQITGHDVIIERFF